MKDYQYDEKSDSLYIHVRDGEEDRFEEIIPGINLEYDSKGRLIGVEVLRASRFRAEAKG